MRKTNLSALCATLVVALINLPVAIQAQYCSIRGCCPGRNDECTMRIHDTMCYCDMFCNRSLQPDCCPDFWFGCLRIAPPTEAPRPQSACVYNGVTYSPGSTVQQNCNKCTCTAASDGSAFFVCDQNQCLIQADMIGEINSENVGWRASNYSFLWGLTQSDGVEYRLGTFPPGPLVSGMREVETNTDGRELPESFDARDKWPGLIGGVMDQGNCGSSWAISTTGVASDRLAIQSMGSMRPPLSEQHLLSCNIRGQRGCGGGYLDRAWYYMRRSGVVTRECYPYESGLLQETTMKKLVCRVPYGTSQCPNTDVRSGLYKATPPYRIAARETDIMTEIRNNGPVQATFVVKDDFFVYNSGVYRHVKSGLSAAQDDPDQAGWHSVKIVGWGVDRSDPYYPIKYWLCTNSWGTTWGEEGMFRIVRGENECQIESFVLGVWMRVNYNMMKSG